MSTKKNTEFRKITNYTSHTLRLCSLQYSRMPYMCVFSFYGHALKPYFWPHYRNWCQLKLLSLATCYNQYSRKKKKN